MIATKCVGIFSEGKSKIPYISVFQNFRTSFITKLLRNQSPKLEFYNKVKTEFILENHLNSIIFKYHAALPRLRISAHCLEIKRRRYGSYNAENSIPREHRLSTLLLIATPVLLEWTNGKCSWVDHSGRAQQSTATFQK